ncbi:MAG: hypothetical protein R3C13_12320 [Hyphomonas sp.]|uniref:glycosyl transferase n=1 Tax=Hyphomonas sp. TaxID=87 RepID=UPI003526FACD
MSGNARIAELKSVSDAGVTSASRRLAFFGHDASDAAVRRRVQALQDDGVRVQGFMMRRGEAVVTAWDNIDLGQTQDGAFIQRLRRIFAGARIAAKRRDDLAAADMIYARNLDMLACAFLAKRYAGLDTPVIYESLDVHRLLTRSDVVGRLMRWLEGALLARTKGLVVSSPAFLRNHFERHYPGRYRAVLVENRLAAGADYGPRPSARTFVPDGKLRIGWVGILRCQRSFDLLCKLADELPDAVEIHLHGIPARTEIAVFEPEIEARANMTYHGRYKSPEDLARIYSGLDVVWAGDFMEAGFNSVWLLPNRIYEGGYYGVPAIAPADTETARWIEARKAGFALAEPLEEALPCLAEELQADPSGIQACFDRLSALPDDHFVQPPGFLNEVINRLVDEGRQI